MTGLRGLLGPRASFAIAAAAVLVGVGVDIGGAFDRVESATVDTRFALRGDREPDGRIVVVKIDADTFGALGRRWPFPRSLHATVIDRLSEAGAAAIAYDVQFSEPTTPMEDNALIDAIRRAGTVVLAATEVDDGGTANVLGSGATQRAARAHVGFSGFPVQEGGVIRRVPAIVDGLPSFARVTAQVFRGLPATSLGFGEDAWIDFAGPPRTYPAIDFADVVDAAFDPQQVRGRVAVVGAYAPSLQDVHPTAVAPGDLMPGAEVQANAIATILRDRPLRSASRLLSLLAVVALGAALPLAALVLRRGLVPLALVLGIGYLAVTQLAFGSGTVLPLVAPLVALALAAAAVVSGSLVVATLEQRRARDQLGRFVPAGLVGTMMKGADQHGALAGRESVATAVCCDLRGFTTFAASSPPSVVVEALNAYFSTMGEAVEAHGGIVVSYAGDGIIAVFGAPLAASDHADRALDAAREMAGWRLAALNEQLRGRVPGGFSMGIGIASGPLVTGTVGSMRRLEFTAIGDPVNVAARVEQLTKERQRAVLVVGSTVELVASARDDLEPLGRTTVRGRDEDLELFALVVAV